ncbi:SH3 domain-containing protein 19-like isoform X3 [Periophthalmus magnuspinnatus]|uniref:SH3 domain-containing protein 19-like isoform X3 n=1 Tax=Periophthalmus magnuspinnatus TaxID=409849 RepID=UPI002436C767|nr:SH3 domain-containing protein 19-like isoform X3 [Periophthalmus magnuspinnatus]
MCTCPQWTVRSLHSVSTTMWTQVASESAYDIGDTWDSWDDDASQSWEAAGSNYEYVEYTQSKNSDYDSEPKTYEAKAPGFPVQPRPSVGSTAPSRQSMTRRPTIIGVPKKSASFSDGVLDGPPPVPMQMPVQMPVQTPMQTPVHMRAQVLKAPPANRHSVSSFPTQVTHSPRPEPTLPPRRLTASKTLPPRPPLVRSDAGRPPSSWMEAAGRSNSAPWDSMPKPQPQAPTKRGPVLPPRPNPGHRLYNKYTLQVPHAVASTDYDGSSTGELSFQKNEVLVLLNPIDSSTYECQVGDRRGRVHRSSMKVITPLTTASDASAAQGGELTASGSGLTVEALFDFSPENPDELSLKAGDVVTQVEQVDSQWYRGTCSGSTGFFPINYVRILENSPQWSDRNVQKPSAKVSGPRCVARFDFEAESSDELSFSEGDVIQLKAYVGQDWARGTLGTFSGIFPLNFVEIVQDLPPAPTPQPATPNKIALPGLCKTAHDHVTPECGLEWVVALYDFSGNTEGDLSFETGDQILVIQHLDSDWSCGRLHGREGIFPRAFVTAPQH